MVFSYQNTFMRKIDMPTTGFIILWKNVVER